MKSRDHHSTIYNNAWMPFAPFYNGGEAVHYSPTFARDGWGTPQALRGSHGCTNLRGFNGAAWLFDQVQIATGSSSTYARQVTREVTYPRRTTPANATGDARGDLSAQDDPRERDRSRER